MSKKITEPNYVLPLEAQRILKQAAEKCKTLTKLDDREAEMNRAITFVRQVWPECFQAPKRKDFDSIKFFVNGWRNDSH